MGKFPKPSRVGRSLGPINRGLKLLKKCVLKESPWSTQESHQGDGVRVMYQ